MTRASFRQADIERILRAARREGFAVQIDIRSLVVTAFPDIHKPDPVDTKTNRARILPLGNFAPDGEEHLNED